MNEICRFCRAYYDAATDQWWPGDCVNCVARFRSGLCEHPCSWIFLEETNGDRR